MEHKKVNFLHSVRLKMLLAMAFFALTFIISLYDTHIILVSIFATSKRTEGFDEGLNLTNVLSEYRVLISI